MAYYDGTKLLSMLDLDGNKPEIYMCTTNRTGGKTTYFGRLMVNRFLKKKEKFCLVYRYSYELDEVADKFFKDIGGLFFPGMEMTARPRAKGKFTELLLDEIPCGYAIALNSADMLKKYSHLFSDVSNMLFDEFQSETNHYCPDEVKKFLSVHTSIARGQGKQTRYVPVYMCSNPVSMINPYYVEMGISSRLRSDTQFLRGKGFVIEQGYVEAAATALQESAFNQAFSNNSYVSYAAQAVYLNDSTAFIDTPTGSSRYLATLKYNGTDFALREYADIGIIYCDKRVDSSFPSKLVVSTSDHEVNYVMLRRNDLFLGQMRYFFEKGCFRFKDLQCKDAVLKALSY